MIYAVNSYKHIIMYNMSYNEPVTIRDSTSYFGI